MTFNRQFLLYCYTLLMLVHRLIIVAVIYQFLMIDGVLRLYMEPSFINHTSKQGVIFKIFMGLIYKMVNAEVFIVRPFASYPRHTTISVESFYLTVCQLLVHSFAQGCNHSISELFHQIYGVRQNYQIQPFEFLDFMMEFVLFRMKI